MLAPRGHRAQGTDALNMELQSLEMRVVKLWRLHSDSNTDKNSQRQNVPLAAWHYRPLDQLPHWYWQHCVTHTLATNNNLTAVLYCCDPQGGVIILFVTMFTLAATGNKFIKGKATFSVASNKIRLKYTNWKEFPFYFESWMAQLNAMRWDVTESSLTFSQQSCVWKSPCQVCIGFGSGRNSDINPTFFGNLPQNLCTSSFLKQNIQTLWDRSHVFFRQRQMKGGIERALWSLDHLLINLDRGPCCKTTNDLHMQQW